MASGRCCDALGATFEGTQVGSFGDMATLSFIQHIISRWVKVELFLPIMTAKGYC